MSNFLWLLPFLNGLWLIPCSVVNTKYFFKCSVYQRSLKKILIGLQNPIIDCLISYRNQLLNLIMADLGPPVRVSPLIKFGRWSFLAVGVVYGAFHHNRLTKKEALYKETEGKKKAERDAVLAEQKRNAAEKELKELEEMAK